MSEKVEKEKKLLRAGEVKAEYGLDAKTLASWPELGLPLRWVDLPQTGKRRGERRYLRSSLEACLRALGGGGGDA